MFVGGLPYSTTLAELEEMFSKYGKVLSAVIITDKFTGRSKGFGFVEMEEAEAEEAIKGLNDTMVGDRKIAVNEARPMEERAPRRYDNGGGNRGGFRRDDRGGRGGFDRNRQ